MSRKWILGLLLAAGVLAATALAASKSRDAKGTQDLAGVWRLDPAKSELPSRMGRGPGGGGWGGRGGGGGGRWGGRGGGGGGWGGRGGAGGEGGEAQRGDAQGGPGPRGGRGGRLPELIEIKQGGGVIAFADSTGTLLQEIRTEESGAPPSSPVNADGVRELTGHWDGGTLIAEWTAPWGGSVVQKASLEDHGRLLEIKVERKGGGGGGGGRRGPGEIKMVYRRNS